jgi:hypothetical protein
MSAVVALWGSVTKCQTIHHLRHEQQWQATMTTHQLHRLPTTSVHKYMTISRKSGQTHYTICIVSFWHISGSNGKTESWCWLTLKRQCSNLTTQPTPWILALAYVWKWNDVFWKQPSIKTQLHIVSERQHNCSLYLETHKACREFYHEKSSQASIVKNLARPLLHTSKCKSTIQDPWEGDWVRFTEQRGKNEFSRLVLQQCYWLQMARNKT